jgi:TRAP-type C4-dicarboxylate transport system permease small subunit
MATLPTAGAARTGTNVFLRIVAGISTLCGWIAAAMILSAVFITCQMIFVRFVLGQSTIWQTEAVIYLVVGATLLGLPYVQLMRGHVNVDLMPIYTKGRVRMALAFLVLGASIVIIGIMAYYAYEMWHFAWARGWRSEPSGGRGSGFPTSRCRWASGCTCCNWAPTSTPWPSGSNGPSGWRTS